ncbi:PHD finger protein 10-like [Saccostrea echinata]|uniref:PHD finger protein 10-like n=1 Tax=Saccostrea echinata TaxID=191078 RepID=UPI002A7EA9E2|nr:PHD finger protein 10-like [Saccostrea echinata]XP_061173120.1 PHD finger protein 10-like [Saccostrea echinata]
MEEIAINKQPERSDIISNCEDSPSIEEKKQMALSGSSINIPQEGDRAFRAISEGKFGEHEAKRVFENKAASLMSTGLSQLGSYSSGSDSEEDSQAPAEACQTKSETSNEKNSQSETVSQSSVTVGKTTEHQEQDLKENLNILEKAMECTKQGEQSIVQHKSHERELSDVQNAQDGKVEILLGTNQDKTSEDLQSVTSSLSENSDQKMIDHDVVSEETDVSEKIGMPSERSHRSESTGFEVEEPVDIPTGLRKPSRVEVIDEESNSSFIKLDSKMKDSPSECDIPPSPYGVSEISETPGPPSPTSIISNGDSVSLQAFDNFGPPTPSSVAESSSMGPTPSKRSRLAVYTPSQEHITANKLFEYQWPTDSSGEYYMLQEQVCEYLGVKSFKRKYPDLFRRQVDIKERVFLMEKGVVTESQADLGLTALKSDEVCDLMHRDYPSMYQEYAEVLHERQKQKISEKHKEYEVPKLEKSKMSMYIKKAMKSAAEWNSNFQKERREERKAYLDLQTFNIHYPKGRYKVLPKELTKPNTYPISLIPGQFQNYFKRYSPDEIKYLPMNTAMFNPPKQMGTTLANPQEQAEPETASEEDENASGSDSDSDDSSSGSEGTSGGEDGEKKTGETKEAAPVDPSICSICNQSQNEEVKSEADLVVCSECSKGGHPGCLDLTNEMVVVIRTYPWQCMDCKTCVECMDPYDEDKMMFCDLCDRGYHTFCVGLKSIPTGHWKCKSCKGPETPKPSRNSKTPRSSSKGTGRKRGRPPLKGKDKKKSKKKSEPKEEIEVAEEDTTETKEGEDEEGEEGEKEEKEEEEEAEEMETEESQE